MPILCPVRLARPFAASHLPLLLVAALASISARPLLAGPPAAAQAAPAGGAAAAGDNRPFIHPGLLHNDEDFRRMAAAVHAGQEPWLSGWNKLTANSHARLSYRPRPRGNCRSRPLRGAGELRSAFQRRCRRLCLRRALAGVRRPRLC